MFDSCDCTISLKLWHSNCQNIFIVVVYILKPCSCVQLMYSKCATAMHAPRFQFSIMGFSAQRNVFFSRLCLCKLDKSAKIDSVFNGTPCKSKLGHSTVFFLFFVIFVPWDWIGVYYVFSLFWIIIKVRLRAASRC